jgi:predicted nucleic acid-binding protein
MIVAELDRWMLQRNWATIRQRRIAAFLERFTIVLAERAHCRTWAEVSDHARRKGRPILTADAWSAATALALDVPLVTNNRDEYTAVDGLEILVPGTAATQAVRVHPGKVGGPARQ